MEVLTTGGVSSCSITEGRLGRYLAENGIYAEFCGSSALPVTELSPESSAVEGSGGLGVSGRLAVP